MRKKIYVTSMRYRSKNLFRLYYREFEDINEAENFVLILKMFNGIMIGTYKNIKIRDVLYSNEYGFFDNRLNNNDIGYIVDKVLRYYY